MNYYVFYTDITGNNCYERICGTKEAAKQRIDILKRRYKNAEYFENNIPKNYKYFY